MLFWGTQERSTLIPRHGTSSGPPCFQGDSSCDEQEVSCRSFFQLQLPSCGDKANKICQLTEAECWCPLHVARPWYINTNSKNDLFIVRTIEVVNELLIVIQRKLVILSCDLLYELEGRSQPPSDNTEIVFPYQLIVEKKCLMFVCWGKLVIVTS